MSSTSLSGRNLVDGLPLVASINFIIILIFVISLFLNEYLEQIMSSTSLSGGNLVDGLPLVSSRRAYLLKLKE